MELSESNFAAGHRSLMKCAGKGDRLYMSESLDVLKLRVLLCFLNEVPKTCTVTGPIIMLTAKGDERDELNGFDIGADEYISKPLDRKSVV